MVKNHNERPKPILQYGMVLYQIVSFNSSVRLVKEMLLWKIQECMKLMKILDSNVNVLFVINGVGYLNDKPSGQYFMTGFGKGKFTGTKLIDNFGESQSNSWRTPKELFNALDNEFDFDTDLAAAEDNKLCTNRFTEKEDAMLQEWHGVCYLNPPFGDKKYPLKKWIEKAYNESKRNGTTIVMLIPARTNTNWWHEYVMKSKEVRFIKGRPKFIGNIHGLPWPLVLVMFENHFHQTWFTSLDYKKLLEISN